mmetsp:Transcript_25742/g.66589  ORF Transcript_25742/g.66589 Transcript_25742/m.66589 type:complete len:191 (+) Transcript_25742:13-585(+)
MMDLHLHPPLLAHEWHWPHLRMPQLPRALVHTKAQRDAPLDVDAAHNRGLDVRESLIPGAGLGLFATRSFARGETICEYTGRVLTLRQILRMSVPEREYVMGGFGLNTFVDAGPDANMLARYINDNQDDSALNAEFVRIMYDHRALVIATRNVKPGEEIYASYGSRYWVSRAPSPGTPATPPPVALRDSG